MPEHSAVIQWKRQAGDFLTGKYDRTHQWSFDGGFVLEASASPSVVPAPHSNAALIDPEEAFVASLASCHMLWFLSIAAGKSIVVENYSDNAIGTMKKNSAGRIAICEVLLRPTVAFERDDVAIEQHQKLHELAHERCFLASSVNFEIKIEPKIGNHHG